MPVNLFISFAQEDREQVESLRSLAQNPENQLEFHDRSELEPMKDRAGTPLPYPPNDSRAKPIREELKRLFDRATKMVVIIGKSTHESQWVNWEVRTFYDRKKNIPGKTKQRIRALKLKGYHDALLPKAIKDLSIPTMNWDLKTFYSWLIANPSDKRG
ncbi:MAG: TIR domain-containing protein [Dehalococcoides mccartyi]|uniref:TIR domain-containing protein n=1 Tax=Dehalococcoides TaxID=61434 RepID=UPI0027379B81|nr:TIR domain-containing protein [Dehalococcoides mccartyi]MDP4279514.1 TIR domain-containing protein [Dehalococcoides mccartyi]